MLRIGSAYDRLIIPDFIESLEGIDIFAVYHNFKMKMVLFTDFNGNMTERAYSVAHFNLCSLRKTALFSYSAVSYNHTVAVVDFNNRTPEAVIRYFCDFSVGNRNNLVACTARKINTVMDSPVPHRF